MKHSFLNNPSLIDFLLKKDLKGLKTVQNVNCQLSFIFINSSLDLSIRKLAGQFIQKITTNCDCDCVFLNISPFLTDFNLQNICLGILSSTLTFDNLDDFIEIIKQFFNHSNINIQLVI